MLMAQVSLTLGQKAQFAMRCSDSALVKKTTSDMSIAGHTRIWLTNHACVHKHAMIAHMFSTAAENIPTSVWKCCVAGLC